MRIEYLFRERSAMREEIQTREKGIRAVIMTFLTVLVGFVAVSKDPRIVVDENVRSTILFWLAQIEVFCGFLITALFINLNAHSGYMRSLELRINDLAKTNLVVWDSATTGTFLKSPRSAFYQCVALLFVIGAGLLLWLSWVIVTQTDKTSYPLIMAIEIALVVTYAVLGTRVSKKVRARADLAFATRENGNEPG